MADVQAPDDVNEPAWRQRAVSRSLNAARSRAEQRVQRFLDAAFELIDEKGTTEFTIQEVLVRSKQSLRGFYQYFDGKDELLLALFEEAVRESTEDLQGVIESESDPFERLHAFCTRLHEWCDPSDTPPKRGAHNRRPIMEFSVQLVVNHPERVKAAMAPDLTDDARARQRRQRRGCDPRGRHAARGRARCSRRSCTRGSAIASSRTPSCGSPPKRPGRSASTVSARRTERTYGFSRSENFIVLAAALVRVARCASAS